MLTGGTQSELDTAKETGVRSACEDDDDSGSGMTVTFFFQMSLSEENLLLAGSACISQCISGADAFQKFQEKSSEVQPKSNRLKLQKKTAGKESPAATKTGCDVLLVNCNEIYSEAYNKKCLSAAQVSTKNINQSEARPRREVGGRCSAPKHDLLPSKRSLKQSKLNLKEVKVSCVQLNEDNTDGVQCFSTADSEIDIIDLCGDDEAHKHVSVVTAGHVREQGCYNDPAKASVTETIRIRRNYGDVQSLSATSEMQKAARDHDALFKSAKSHKETSSGWRDVLSPETREELLQQIQAQNQLFPVRRFFSRLLERQSQSEKGLTRRGSEVTAARSAPVSEKRKQDTVVLHDEQPPKRQRWNRDAVSVNVPQNPDRPHIKPASRSRLSVSRRKKQQSTPPPVQSECSAGETTRPECVLREDDVLWTEKYQPQCSEEIIGNSAAMRKLHRWLTEWRMRADVEERRKRQEERRRMQEESKESWDCGDFEGERVMVDSEVELCNTVLIQGPAGAGKTAAVYACAQELGYKVFEVNSSSLRSGQIVLSHLREATQSHQVGVLQSGSTKPQNSHSTDPPAASTVASRKDASRKLLTSTKKSSSRKTSVGSRNAPRKKSTAPATVTLKHFFKRTQRPVDKSTDSPQDPHGSDETKPDVIIESDSNAKGSSEGPILNTEDRKNRTPSISLILFEEVDIIFSEDVGLLTAIKTLMTTTKRPIILTANDPLFSKTFNSRYEEIHFKTPPVETTRSYLHCLCVVESTWLAPDDLSALLAECEGDVRRSVLELELWTRSGGGRTRRHVQNTALTCGSWAELENTGCLDVLVEIWRTGRSLFYSNLDVLFAPLSRTSKNTDRNASEADSLRFKEKLEKEENSPSLSVTRPGKLSRLKVRKHKAAGDELKMTHSPCSKLACLHLDIFDQPASPVKCQSERFSAEESSSKLVSCCLETLAQFFDTMSFLDSCIYKQQLQVHGQCQAGPQGWMGAKLTDSLVDELREEDVNPHSERSYELLAVLESLGFHQCRGELSETRRKAEKLKEVMEGETFTHLMEHVILSESADASASQKSKPGADQKSKEVINKVLSSKAFRCHGNKKAVAMDYLPALRCICRMERAKQQSRPRSLHYLSVIRLPLPKSTLKLLALDLH
ncbi:hypothetical protein SRHO_G00335670 [Serrasalmus rhombeus]